MIDAYRLAAKALGEMQRLRVCPTAEAYEVWLAYLADTHPALTRQMNELLASGQKLTQVLIRQLRDKIEPETPGPLDGGEDDSAHAMLDGLEDVADALVQHATDGRTAICRYGEVLAQSMVQLGSELGGAEGVRVIAMLTSETVKMAEHNRELRDRLASTSARAEKLRRMLAEEKQAASTDQLTGLSNRRAFDAKFKRVLGKIQSEGSSIASLLMLDIDYFKHFNDTYGHNTGDLVLRLVGRLLIENIKGRDIAARYGGEEFAILLIGADLDAAAEVARQICTTLANKRFKLTSAAEQGQSRVTISIGVAQLRVADAQDAAIARADAALYAAKRAGRNRVVTEREVVPA